jgi:hypothetical protein
MEWEPPFGGLPQRRVYRGAFSVLQKARQGPRRSVVTCVDQCTDAAARSNINDLRIVFQNETQYAIQPIDIIRLHSRTCGALTRVSTNQQISRSLRSANGCNSVAARLRNRRQRRST